MSLTHELTEGQDFLENYMTRTNIINLQLRRDTLLVPSIHCMNKLYVSSPGGNTCKCREGHWMTYTYKSIEKVVFRGSVGEEETSRTETRRRSPPTRRVERSIGLSDIENSSLSKERGKGLNV